MSLFKSRTLTVTRFTAGSEVKGRWVEGMSSTFSIECTIQPTSGYQVKALIEGKRLSGIYEIITATQLFAADPLTGISGDRVTLDGKEFEVIQVSPWQNGLIPHYEAIAIREKEVQ